MAIEFLYSLLITKILIAGLLSIGYLAYLKVLLNFILKQVLLCSLSIGLSSYQCKKRAYKNIQRLSFLQHNPNITIYEQSYKISGQIKISKPSLISKSYIKIK